MTRCIPGWRLAMMCFGLTLTTSACADIPRDEPLVDILFERNLVNRTVPGRRESGLSIADDAAPAPSAVEGLPPQALAQGECGAFFWDRTDPNPLIVFENESRGAAVLWVDGGLHRTSMPVRTFDYRSGQSLSRTYGAGDQNVTVSGTITEVRGSEAIVGRALMRQQQSDGSEIVRPVIGLISCRS